MHVAMDKGENSVVIDDKPVKISGIKYGNISEISIQNSEEMAEIAIKTGLGTINLVQGKSRSDGKGPERGLLFFTMVSNGKTLYLTPADWKELRKEDIPYPCEFPKDAVCIPVNHRLKGFP